MPAICPSVPPPLLLLLLLLAAACAPVGAKPVKVAFLSDLHLDVYYGTPLAQAAACGTAAASPYGTLGCDSPYALVESAIADLMNHSKPALTVVAGDWLRHDMAAEKAAANATYRMIAQKFAELDGDVLGAPNVVTALGNNDFVPDYFFDVANPTPPKLLGQMADDLRAARMLRASEHASFARYGYYARAVANTTLTVVVLNTLIWTHMLMPAMATGPDPCKQFAFLETALAAAKAAGRKVLVMSHVPPTVNFYAVAHGAPASSQGSYYWQPQYEAKYLALLREHRATVAAQLFGHTHRFSFVGDASVGVPLFVLPAVSPVYGNNPNYLVVEMDDATFAVTDAAQRWFDLAAFRWATGLSLRQAYPAPAWATFGVAEMAAVGAELPSAARPAVFRDWLFMYGGNRVADKCQTAACRQLASCYTQHIRTADVFACVNAFK
jgi:predicted phosphodiesterase